LARPKHTPELPRHIAIIMDGNGRWARRRGKPRSAGHRAGAERINPITKECSRLGIEQLTLYAFSMENWRRPKTEVAVLMRLLVRHLRKELPAMMDDNVRFRAIGRLDALPASARKAVRETERQTAENTGTVLCLALSYGGRTEIADAARAIAERARDGSLRPKDVTERSFGGFLYTAGMPDPDLLIRTAGEMRVSNFLLWQTWYTELYVTDVLWPDFTPEELGKAIREYGRRERRFGNIRPKKGAPSG